MRRQAKSDAGFRCADQWFQPKADRSVRACRRYPRARKLRKQILRGAAGRVDTLHAQPWPRPSACRNPRAALQSRRRSGVRDFDSRASSLHSSSRASGDWTVVRAAGARSSSCQRKLQSCGLRGLILRPAGGIAQRKIGKQQARHADIFDDVLGAAHHHRRNSAGLQHASGEADALMADRAIGDEDGRIHVIGAAASDDFGTIDVRAWSGGCDWSAGHGTAALPIRSGRARSAT